MIQLSQRDPKWAAKKLGRSSLTLGRWGCTTTCLSMLSDFFGSYVAPDLLAKQTTLYSAGGLIIWKNLKIPKMRFIERSPRRNDAKIKASLVDPNKACILEVAHKSHWVVPIRETYNNIGFMAVDPWTGKICSVFEDYRNITGSAHFERV